MIELLPVELQTFILSFLDLSSRATCSHTSRSFNSLLADPTLWRGRFLEHTPKHLPPGPRTCSGSALLGSTLYVYGGDEGALDASLVKNTSDELWAFRFDGGSEDFGGRSWVLRPCELPKLTEHSVVGYENHLYVFGGNTEIETTRGHGVYTDALFRIDIDTMEVNKIKALSGPRARSGHSAVVHGHHMYVFGGWDGASSLDDMHAFDLVKHKWIRILGSGHVPEARRAHSAVLHSGKMYLFGGYNPESHLDQLHCFDFETLKWSLTPRNGTIPSERSHAMMAVDREYIMVIGGSDRRSVNGDVYRYDTVKETWEEYHTNLSTLCGGTSQAVCCVVDGWLMIFGGYSGILRRSTSSSFVMKLV